MTEDKKGMSREEKVLAEAKERYKLCQDYYSTPRAKALDDLLFLDGQDGAQWGEAQYRQRILDQRPALTVNRMDQFVQHITNALRQNRIAARVFPVDDAADNDTAEIIQGYLRHIEANSDGDLAYGTASFYAVACGEGYYILRQKYCSPLSFDTDLEIERVSNLFQVYLDPNHRHPSGKDAKYGFKVTKFSKDEYEKEFGEKSPIAWDTDIDNDWIEKDDVRIVEYFVIECKSDTLIRLADGSARLKSDIPEDIDPALLYIGDDGKPVERDTYIETVKWYKLNGKEILDETVWPTVPEYVALPIIKVVGNELDLNGKQVLKGIIRNLKDAQRQYNFMLSAETEAIDSSKGQTIVVEGQLEGHENEWADMSKKKLLTVKGVDVDGRPAPMPTRLPANASIQAMNEARMMAADDLKAIAGIYDSALGAQSNETSGRAINSRQAQSDTANYHFTGNLVRSINHSTKLLIGAIPTVIDTPRAIRIIGEDEKQKVVKVNQQLQQGYDENTPQQPGDKVYKVGGGGVGKYDVVCEAGPSPSTMKEERAIRMTEMVKVAPGLMNVAPDLILKDLGASFELVERVKKSLPPDLQDDKQDDPAQKLAQMGQQMQQLSQQHEQLTQALNEAQQKIDTQQVQADSKERIEMAKIQMEQSKLSLEERKLQIELAIHQTQLDSNEAIAMLKAEVDSIKVGMQLDAQKAAQEADRAAQEIGDGEKGESTDAENAQA